MQKDIMIHSTFEKVNIDKKFAFLKVFCYICTQNLQNWFHYGLCGYSAFINAYHRKLATTDLRFKRYLYDRINWDVRLVGIKGARGVGKTTMLMQHIKETFDNIDDVLYVSLDNLWFENHRLEELVEFLYTHGVMHIYFDEVHKYKNWTALLKYFYDSYPDLNIV